MEYWTLFGKGILTALSINIPIGPVTFVCAQATLTQGRRAGIIAGLGSATALVVYAIVALLGLPIVCLVLNAYQWLVYLIGAFFLMYFAARSWNITSLKVYEQQAGTFLWRVYGSVFLFSLTNPLTFILCSALLLGGGVLETMHDTMSKIIFVKGMFIGSVLWWTLVAFLIDGIRTNLSEKVIRVVNRCVAVVFFLFAGGLLVRAAQLVQFIS